MADRLRPALLLFVAVLAAGCGGSLPASPTPENTTPPSPVLVLTIDSHGSTVAVASITSVTADLTISAGSGLQYQIDWGDGQTSTSARATHTYSSSSSGFVVKATLTDRFGRAANASRSVKVMTFADAVMANFFCPGLFQHYFPEGTADLFFRSESGGTVSGLARLFLQSTAIDNQFTGAIDGDDNIVMTLDDGRRASGYFVFGVPLTNKAMIYLAGWPSATTAVFYCYSE
jgi:hypothetical protein